MIIYISKILEVNIEDITFDSNVDNKENFISPALKEKKKIITNYYRFIENESCLFFLENCYNVLVNKDINYSRIDCDDDDIITISIIILKGFIDNFNFSNNSIKYINSDELLNIYEDQYKKYLINTNRDLDNRKIRESFFCIINILSEKKILKEKIIVLSGTNYKTIKNYAILNVDYKKTIEDYLIFSKDEFNIIIYKETYYINTFHYSKTYELYHKNFYSNKSFKLKDMAYLEKKINIKLYVDKKIQNEIFDYIQNKYDIANIKKDLEKLIEELNLEYKNQMWNTDNKKKIKLLQSKISNNTNILILKEFSKLNFGNDFIIFPVFMDFRGRKYYNSMISPTSSRSLRLAYHYGYYSQEDFTENNTNEDYKELITQFCITHKFDQNKIFYGAYYWCLIGIGKHFINKNKTPINEKIFILKGIENFNNEYIKNDIEDYIELKHYKNIIHSLTEYNLKNNLIEKRGVLKDATASVNQIFMKKLGPINQKSLDYVNLGEDNYWYDTYIIHREKFYEHIVENKKHLDYHDKEVFDKIFPRKLIKNMIMIIPYSAGFNLCWENYLENAEKFELNIEIDMKKTKKIFEDFYYFVKDKMQELYLYSKKSSILVKEINDDFEKFREYILKTETGEADISYKKLKKSSIDKTFEIEGKKKRITKLILKPSEAIDIKAFNSASGPNLAHFLDADEIREIEKELGYCIITIHDCYIIDFNACEKIVKIKINHYQKNIDKISKIKYRINNKFILL